MISDTATTVGIIASCVIGLVWAWLQFSHIASTEVRAFRERDEEKVALKEGAGHSSVAEQTQKLIEIYEAISRGAEAFLYAEYSICVQFVFGFGIFLFALISWGSDMGTGFLTTLSFVLGAITSIASGYIGMKVAVFSNVRTTINAQKEGYMECFNTAFRAGSVMGFALTGLGIVVLYITLMVYKMGFEEDNMEVMMGCISGYGLGGSSIALFGRVGGGIYTKAADVGADLVGKVVHGIPEDDPRNPATIADNGKY